jgi:hypothetical protein
MLHEPAPGRFLHLPCPNALWLAPQSAAKHVGPRRRAGSAVRSGNDAEQAVMAHEKYGAGLREAARALMVARRVLTTISRSRIFPACGAVSAASGRDGSSPQSRWNMDLDAAEPNRSCLRLRAPDHYSRLRRLDQAALRIELNPTRADPRRGGQTDPRDPGHEGRSKQRRCRAEEIGDVEERSAHVPID